ncbi:MAG: hypothetical protein NC307_14480 [Roseburia sp.]|nr:hypothetical protein [Roseburia sp.]
MKLFLTIIKLILATLGCVFIFRADTVIYQIIMYALCYGLITYYMHYINEWIEDGFDDGFMDDGIIMMLVNFLFKLSLPILVVVFFYWAVQKIFGEKVGSVIAGIGVLLACFGCLISDVVGIIQVFKPDFLNGSSKAESGFIEDDGES